MKTKTMSIATALRKARSLAAQWELLDSRTKLQEMRLISIRDVIADLESDVAYPDTIVTLYQLNILPRDYKLGD